MKPLSFTFETPLDFKEAYKTLQTACKLYRKRLADAKGQDRLYHSLAQETAFLLKLKPYRSAKGILSAQTRGDEELETLDFILAPYASILLNEVNESDRHFSQYLHYEGMLLNHNMVGEAEDVNQLMHLLSEYIQNILEK
ncbi:MAG: hypothetical protein Q4B28_03690 [bacterium]|nr:hypothetical protein [bacterium]